MWRSMYVLVPVLGCIAYWSWVVVSVFCPLFTDYQCWCLFSILCLLIMSVDVFLFYPLFIGDVFMLIRVPLILPYIGLFLTKKLWQGMCFNHILKAALWYKEGTYLVGLKVVVSRSMAWNLTMKILSWGMNAKECYPWLTLVPISMGHNSSLPPPKPIILMASVLCLEEWSNDWGWFVQLSVLMLNLMVSQRLILTYYHWRLWRSFR